MGNAILWVSGKDHWLIILGIFLAVLGAFYNAYGLDQERKIFGGLTQGLSFGLVGGLIFGLGLGLVGILLEVVFIFLGYISNAPGVVMSISGGGFFNILIAFILTGFVLGIIFGFLVGLWLETIQKIFLPPKRFYLLILSSFELIFILSIVIQFVFISAGTLYNQFEMPSSYLDIPLLGGCLFGIMFGKKESFDTFIKKKFGKSDFFLYLISITFPLLIVLTANLIVIFLLTYYSIAIVSYALEFVFGFLICAELNQPQSSKSILRKPSWAKFFLWSVGFGGGFGVVLFVLAILFKSDYFGGLEVVIVLIGIVIGVRKGKIGELLTQPRLTARLTSKRDKFGMQNEIESLNISWARFRRGFLVGFVVFGLYTSSISSSQINIIDIYYLLASGLIGGVPIGFMIGCLYGFGPAILLKVKNLPDYRLGQIGVIMTVFGIVLLALPSLMG